MTTKNWRLQQTPTASLEDGVVQSGVRVEVQGIARHGSSTVLPVPLGAHASRRPLTAPKLPTIVLIAISGVPKGILLKKYGTMKHEPQPAVVRERE